MAEYTGKTTPLIGQMVPRTVRDLGALITAIAAGGAATTTGATQENLSSRGARVRYKLTKNSGTIDVVITIQSYDAGTGEWVDLLSSASLTATGTADLIVHPDLTGAANTVAKNFIGEQWRVKVVSGTGSSPNFDLSIGGCLLP